MRRPHHKCTKATLGLLLLSACAQSPTIDERVHERMFPYSEQDALELCLQTPKDSPTGKPSMRWAKSRTVLASAFSADPSRRVRIFCAYAITSLDLEDKFPYLITHLKAECLYFRLSPPYARTFPLMIQTLRDDDSEAGGIAWEELDKHLNDGSVNSYSEDRKGMADEYQALWDKLRPTWKD